MKPVRIPASNRLAWQKNLPESGIPPIFKQGLMRYYDMNLAQTKFLSGHGILMIVFGVLTVAASSYLYRSQDSDKALLFVGSSSGIIVDFIGAIFIRPSEHS
nr:hypothetical protein [uncultured Oscillibacter sp.]